jgi:ribosome-binding protein aMBF1 (putative translation factor)
MKYMKGHLNWVILHLLGITHLTVSHWNEKRLQEKESLSISRKALGEHLRKKRIELSLSTRQLAEQLGLQEKCSYISLWERNEYYPTERYRTRIIEFLGYDPESLSQH